MDSAPERSARSIDPPAGRECFFALPDVSAAPGECSFALADQLPRIVAELRRATDAIPVPPPTEYERGCRDGMRLAADLLDMALELARNPPHPERTRSAPSST